MKKFKWNSILIILIFTQHLVAQQIPVFKNNDKICFIGNSITQDGRYHMLLQAFFATRFPGNTVDFYNCGISGDVADGVIGRFDKDILALKPNFAFLKIGMNDVQHALYEEGIEVDSTLIAKRQSALDNYYKKTEKIAQLLHDNGITTIFMTPTIYDQTAKIEKSNSFGCNDALEKCAIHIRKLAKKHYSIVVDFYPEMIAINKKYQLLDPTFTIVGADRVHPGDPGHFVMAYHIINKIMPNTKNISSISINAKKKTILKSEKTSIIFDNTNSDLVFNVTQSALPFPVTNRFSKALEFVPFINDKNSELLIFKYLKKGNYELRIDGNKIAIFTSKQLGSGVNLSQNTATPQYKQALQVFELCEKYHEIYGKIRVISLIEYKNLKDYKGPNNFQDKRAYLDADLVKQEGKSWHPYLVKMCNQYFELKPKEQELWNELTEARKNIYSNNLPKEHKYELVKIQ